MRSVAISAASRRVAVSAEEGFVTVWQVLTDQIILHFRSHVKGIFSMAFNKDGSRLACGGNDKDAHIIIWDVSGESGDPTELQQLDGHGFCVNCLMFSPDGLKIASGTYGNATIWCVQSGEALVVFKDHEDPMQEQGHNEVKSVAWSPDSRLLASGGEGATVLVWSAYT